MDLMDLYIKVHLQDDASAKIPGIVSKVSGLADSIGSGLEKAAAIGAAAVEKVASAAAKLATYSVDVGSNFEAQMSKVAAIAGLTAEEMNAITEKAKEMGIKTKFSATEAGEAMYYMAQAGWSASEIISGIEGVMDLAAASGENLASVSDIVTDALTAFGLSASDSAHFADVLAQAAAASNTDVAKLGQTFKYVAPIAGTLGYSIEDVSVAAGLMANAGIKASQAGTSLRSVLSRLASPTEQVKAVMESLSISLTNPDGSSKSLMELMENLRDSFSGLSESEQVAYASTIAAKTGMSGFLAIVNASDEEFSSLTAQINNASGAADRMASVMQDNLKGKFEIFISSLEGFGIAVYEKITVPLQNLAVAGTSAVDSLTEAFKEEGLIGVVNRASEMIQDFAQTLVTEVPQKFRAMADTLVPALNSALEGVSNAILILAPSIAQGAQAAADLIAEKLPELMGNLASFIEENGDKIINAGLSILTTLTTALLASAPALVQTGGELLLQLLDGIVNSLPQITSAAMTVLQLFADAMKDPGNLYGLLDAAIAILTQLAMFFVESLPILVDAAANIIVNFVSYLMNPENLGKLSAAALQLMFSLQKAIIDSVGLIISAANRLAEELGSAIVNADWGGVGSRIVNAFLTGIQSVWDTVVSWVSDAVSGITAMFSGAIASAKDAINTLLGLEDEANGIKDRIGGGGSASEGGGAGRYSDVPTESAGGSSSTKAGVRNVNVTLNVHSEAKTAADLMEEARYQAERAVLFDV